MKKPFYRTARFVREQKRWYKILRAAGFVDIEPESEQRYGRPISGKLINTRTALFQDREAVEAYFQRARAFAHVARFETKLHRRIWEEHAEGATIREIEKRLGVDRNVVWKVIARYRELAGLSRQGTHGRGDLERNKHRKAA